MVLRPVRGHPRADGDERRERLAGRRAGVLAGAPRRFLTTLNRAVALGDDRRLASRLVPAIEFPPLANYTIRDAIVHMGTHNAHHLGQVIILRQ